MSRFALLLVPLLLLAACQRHAPPAPLVFGTPAARPAPQPSTTTRPDFVVVQPGETLYAVSRRYDVPIRSLIEANNLAPPYNLSAGKRLIVPQVRTHVVQQGDTLYSISRRYGVDASSLARTNNLQPPSVVKLGQALILPAPVQPEPQVAAVPLPSPRAPAVAQPERPPTAPSRATPPQQPQPQQPQQAAPVQRAAAPEPMPLPPVAAPPPPVAAMPPAVAMPPVPPAAPSPPAATEPPPPAAPAASPPPAAEEPAPAAPPGKGFIWPVHGKLIAGFGPAAGGTHNDGVNIAAPLGTPIGSADDGVVAYAGNELRGFGNLVLVKHAGGWMTAYAHCASIAVKKGDKVRRGQVIARVGETGTVGEPQLHFELRRGSRALDPTNYLAPLPSAQGEQASPAAG